MNDYLELIKNSYSGYWNYLKNEIITINHWDNYFYGLIAISLIVWLLEIAFPWRKNQALFRKDFWLDTFYLFYRTQMQLGLFFGYTHYLGAFTPLYIDPSTDQPISYSRPIGNTGFSVDYVYRVSLRYSYNLGSFRCGLELEWDLIAYSERLDRYGRGLNPKPVNAFSPIISIDYVY